MPLPQGTKYRYKPGTKIRLAFLNGKVIEAKNMETGDTHTMMSKNKKPTKAKKPAKVAQYHSSKGLKGSIINKALGGRYA